MREFIHEDFLLNNEPARILYHDYAEDMPIIDYHCHLDPRDIAEDRRYGSITEIWLGGDHYKWRAMRTNGVDERFITGDAAPRDKFLKWAETMPALIGNPLYHWTHLELKRYFGISELLGPGSADSIWERCNEVLARPEMSVKGIINRSNVRVICTTDDPADSLEYHRRIKEDSALKAKVLPAFRPDKAINIDKAGFSEYIAALSQASGIPIKSLSDLFAALKARMDYFHANGCRVSDHALDPPVFAAGGEDDADAALRKALNGESVTPSEAAIYKTQLMLFLGRSYSALGWVMQLHAGTMRDANTRMYARLGPNTGYDMIADWNIAAALASYLDALDADDSLPKTILYVLNPRDNEMIATLAGCFQGGGIPGKIQFGSGWWFNDQKDGMLRQMTALANMGLLSRFVGMLTDSRSFLSYTRHEYFRRILCNLVGTWVENGEAPNDMLLLGGMIRDISYNNAARYFDFDI
jgi:glucuronate isomerase